MGRTRALSRIARSAEVRLRLRLLAIEDAVFERRTGSRSRATIEPTDLTVSEGVPGDGFTYVPTPAALLRWILRSIPLSPQESTFVDLGSGMGRAVVAAVSAGYRRAVGVEFATELHDAACTNQSRTRVRREALAFVLGDAGRFHFPPEPLAVYLNNPFNEQVMTAVIENLSLSYATVPRPIVVCYQQMIREEPRHTTRNLELLAAAPFLTRADCVPRGRYERFLLSPYAVTLFSTPEAAERTVGQVESEP